MFFNEKKPILVFELGHLQVYYYQTLQEWNSGVPPLEYFWQKKNENVQKGPFKTAYDAVNDYSTKLALEKAPIEPLPNNLIAVDFKAKKRVK